MATLTSNRAAQQVAAFIAGATPASFAAKVGGSTASPNALGRAVTNYGGHSRMFSGVRDVLRAGGYRATNNRWPSLTLAQWQAAHGMAPTLASSTATPAAQGKAHARKGKLLATAAKASGASVPRGPAVLPPMAATRTQGSGARAAANTAAPTPAPSAPAPTPAAGS